MTTRCPRCEHQFQTELQLPSFAGRFGLTALEIRVADLATQRAMTNREIGLELNLAEHTIKNQFVHIFDKLGIDNRMGLFTALLKRPR